MKEGFEDETLKPYEPISLMNVSHPLEVELQQETININDGINRSDLVLQQRGIVLHVIFPYMFKTCKVKDIYDTHISTIDVYLIYYLQLLEYDESLLL